MDEKLKILRQLVMDLREHLGFRELLIREGMHPSIVDQIAMNGIEEEKLLEKYAERLDHL